MAGGGHSQSWECDESMRQSRDKLWPRDDPFHQLTHCVLAAVNYQVELNVGVGVIVCVDRVIQRHLLSRDSVDTFASKENVLESHVD
jgi:hypothetical protein